MNEIDEPRVVEEKDQHAIDMVMVNAFMNAPNVHGVAVVPGPVVANHAIEARA